MSPLSPLPPDVVLTKQKCMAETQVYGCLRLQAHHWDVNFALQVMGQRAFQWVPAGRADVRKEMSVF